MLNEHTISIADTYWAAHLGCQPNELFAEAFHIVTHGKKLADYCGVFAVFRDAAAIASVPSGRADTLRMLLAGLSHGCSPAGFACLWSCCHDSHRARLYRLRGGSPSTGASYPGAPLRRRGSALHVANVAMRSSGSMVEALSGILIRCLFGRGTTQDTKGEKSGKACAVI